MILKNRLCALNLKLEIVKAERVILASQDSAKPPLAVKPYKDSTSVHKANNIQQFMRTANSSKHKVFFTDS